jgi:sugar phosphate isomerase/epimerase
LVAIELEASVIKIASMVGAPDLQTRTLGPYQGDFDEAFKKLSDLGYDGVEIMTRSPYQINGRNLRQLLRKYQLHLTGLCTGHIFGEEKLGLLQPDLTINPAAMERLKEFVDFAAEFLEPDAMVNIGRARGVGDPTRMPETLELARDAFRSLADYAAPRRVRLILEPVSSKEVNFLHSTQDGIQMARMVDRPNFGLMLDTYHMAREDANMYKSFYEAPQYVWHIHFSDVNRRWPGNAFIDYEKVVRVLNDLSYDGYVSTEIQPWPDPDSAARLSIEHLRQFIPAAVH